MKTDSNSTTKVSFHDSYERSNAVFVVVLLLCTNLLLVRFLQWLLLKRWDYIRIYVCARKLLRCGFNKFSSCMNRVNQMNTTCTVNDIVVIHTHGIELSTQSLTQPCIRTKSARQIKLSLSYSSQAAMLCCRLDRQRIRTPKIMLKHSVTEHAELMIREHTEHTHRNTKDALEWDGFELFCCRCCWCCFLMFSVCSSASIVERNEQTK